METSLTTALGIGVRTSYGQEMFGWQPTLRTRSSDHFDPTPAYRRMKPARVRAYSSTDLSACREIYLLNEPGRFPDGVLPEFEEALHSGKSLFLVAERDGAVCACGGIRIASKQRGIVSLCFGMVHPRFHGQGLGTTLLLARFAILPTQYWTVTMSPLPTSKSFYQRFNFQEFGQFDHPVGGAMPQYYVRLPMEARDVCAALLDKARVVLDVPCLDLPGEP